MKICIDARMLFSSGIGTYLQNVIPIIAPFFDITLLTTKKDVTWNKNISAIGVDIPIYSYKEQLLLPFIIPPCDLFWSPHYNIPLLPIRAKKRAVTIHDVCHLAHPNFFPKIKRYIGYKVLQRAAYKSDLIMTVSEYSKKEICSYLGTKESSIEVIWNGVNKNIPSICPKQFHLTDHPFVLFVGNMKPHKNTERLIKAFLELPSKYHLVMVIPKKEILPPNPRIHCLHELSKEELSFLYENASLLVQPSFYEGFGLVPLEAMQKGCPVIVSNQASFPEICADAAFYIDPHNTKSIYTGMKKVLEDPFLRRDLIEKGYKRTEAFSWETSGLKIKDLFIEVLS